MAKYNTFLLNRQNKNPSVLQARVMKFSTNVLGLNTRLFCYIGKIKFSPPLSARRVKSAIGLISKIVNFEARIMKLSRDVEGPNMRHFCQIGKNFPHL